MLVRALAQGFYDGKHIDPGTIFHINGEHYAGVDDPDPNKAAFGWMQKVEKELDPLTARIGPVEVPVRSETDGESSGE